MIILTVRALSGPNIWSCFPVLEALVDVTPPAESSVAARVHQRLTDWMSMATTHGRDTAEPITYVDLLHDPGFLAHSLQRIACELQRSTGTTTAFGQVQPTSKDCIYRLAIGCENHVLGSACLEAALQMCISAATGTEFDVRGEIARLREIAHESRLGPSTRSIVEAAARRDIPAIRLSEGNLIQLGYGSRQRRILAAETDGTGAIAETIAQDKELTRFLLKKIGVPVPLGRSATCASQAWQIACELGLPVVVKPRYGSHGRGVTTNLSTRGQVLAACETALREESTIVVEQFVRGDDYRLLVVGNRVVAAARRDPPAILGDGLHTVAELVAAANDDPRRAEGHAAPLTKLILDTIALEVLAEQGLLPESVPAEGTRALIRRNGNLSTGGSATDVTDDVHPEVAACAIDAARMVGLDVAGIDILAQDIAKPLEEQGGAVIEVNACPGLRMHLHPSHGTPRPVGDSIIDLMFARGESARVPIVAVAGDRDQTTTSRLVAHLLAGMPGHVGLANADGLFVSEHRIEGHDPHDPSQAKSLLLNPLVESAVIAVEPTTILRGGLPFDQCEVAILTEFAAVDASTTGDEPHDDLALANLCLLKSVASSGTAVLNADDRQLAAIADRCTCEMIYFSHDEEHAVLLSHRLSGGRVVFVRDHCIFAAARHHETLVAPLDDLAFTYGGLLGLHVDSALAAVAACWSLGLRWKDVRAALTSFTADLRPLVDMPGARR